MSGGINLDNNNYLLNKFLNYDNVSDKTEYYMFCFGHAGSWSAMFQEWQKELSDNIAIIPVILPGKGERIDERPFSRMEPLVKSVSYVIKEYGDKKIILYGNCLGGLEAFEISRELEFAYGIKVSHVFISAQESPKLVITDEPVHQLGDDEFMEKVKMKNGTPDEVFENEQLKKMLISGLRADFKIYETYKYKEKKRPSFDITVFTGSDDDVKGEKVKDWACETSGKTNFIEIEGDHFFAVHNYRLLLKKIDSIIHE
jgi:medium-chain acyl-[acyl-carrier-protein] hydrolase